MANQSLDNSSKIFSYNLNLIISLKMIKFNPNTHEWYVCIIVTLNA